MPPRDAQPDGQAATEGDSISTETTSNAAAGGPRRRVDEVLTTLAERIGAQFSAATVYGAPVERDGVTVVPVAVARFGIGAGSGSDPTKGQDGEGGGGGGGVTPAGYIELKDGRSRFVPIVLPARMLALVCGAGLAGLLILRAVAAPGGEPAPLALAHARTLIGAACPRADRSRMTESVESEVQSIIDRRDENGGPFWSRADGDIHAPAGFSTIEVLNVLGELGATPSTRGELAEAIGFVLGYQTPEGGFRYSRASSKLPCMPGQILAGLARLGAAEDPWCERRFVWLLDTQAGDGGWCCATVKLGRSPETDAGNPGATPFVLDAFRHRLHRVSEDERGCLDRGVASLLRHGESRSPLGPRGFGIGSRFLRVGIRFDAATCPILGTLRVSVRTARIALCPTSARTDSRRAEIRTHLRSWICRLPLG